MATYKKFEKDGYKVQVESAVRDGVGKNIENNYAKQNGYYGQLTSGSADSLTPYGDNSGASDTTPFVFQTTGGDSDVSNKAYLRELRGNSVAFNMLFSHPIATTTTNDVTITNNGDGSFKINGIASADTNFDWVVYAQNVNLNHKFLIKGCVSGGSSSTFVSNMPYVGDFTTTEKLIFVNNNTIATYFNYNVRIKSGASINQTIKPQIIDLTLMFGAGNEPTSVVEFNRLFPKTYYDYNAGTLLSCKVNGIKNVGYNALSLDRTAGTLSGTSNTSIRTFDETKYYVGLTSNNYYNSTNVSNVSYQNGSITLTGGAGYGLGLPVRVICGQTYTIEYTNSGSGTNDVRIGWYDQAGNWLSASDNKSSGGTVNVPDNAYWGVIVLRPNGEQTYTNICFHLTWDGSRTGYEEHKVWQYALPNIELKSAGSVYDTLTPSGLLTRNVGVVKLKDLAWIYENGVFRVDRIGTSQNPLNAINSNNYRSNLYSFIYRTGGENPTTLPDKHLTRGYYTNRCVFIKDSSYTSSTDFINHFTDNDYLYYELATSTEEQTTNTFQEIQDIDDFGTQEFLYDNDIAIPIPQGNDFFYPVDYKAFIDSLGGREDIEYDASEIVSQSELASAIVHSVEFKTDFSASDSGTISDTDDIALLGKFINQQIFPSVIKIKAKYAASGVITSNYYITDGRLIIKYGSYNNNGYWGLRISYYDNTYTHLT